MGITVYELSSHKFSMNVSMIKNCAAEIARDLDISHVDVTIQGQHTIGRDTVRGNIQKCMYADSNREVSAYFIMLKSTLSPQKLLEVLMHEFRHLWQFENNQYSVNDSKLDDSTPYLERPCEIDARNYSEGNKHKIPNMIVRSANWNIKRLEKIIFKQNIQIESMSNAGLEV